MYTNRKNDTNSLLFVHFVKFVCKEERKLWAWRVVTSGWMESW